MSDEEVERLTRDALGGDRAALERLVQVRLDRERGREDEPGSTGSPATGTPPTEGQAPDDPLGGVRPWVLDGDGNPIPWVPTPELAPMEILKRAIVTGAAMWLANRIQDRRGRRRTG